MAPKTEYDLVCDTVADYQVRLEKIWAKTGSYTHATQIDEALRGLKEWEWYLISNMPVSGTDWVRPPKLMDAIALAEKVENETVRWHSQVGWTWFAVFTVGLLALVGSYLWLHGPEANSFYWKGVSPKYVEIAFWLGFGLLVFILYSIQHYVRDGWDVGLYGLWYISKLLQGVFIGFVIVLFFIEFKFTVAGLDVDFSKSPMPIFRILAFILGYYSDQSRKYLDVIRDRFFAANDVPEVDIVSPADSASATTDIVVVRGTVTGAQGMKGTISIGKADPIELKLDSSGNFARQVELAKGVNLIRVEATNPNGKVGSKGISVTRSGPGLVLTLTSSLATAPVDKETLQLEGVLKDDVGTPAPARPVYLLMDKKEPQHATTDVNGKFVFDVTLSPGDNHIKVVAGQPEGDLVAESVDVTYSTSTPILPPIEEPLEIDPDI